MPPKPATRKRNGSLTVPDEYQDIKTALEGRKFLEKHSILCPPGEPTTNKALSICLHQVAAMNGLPKQALNAIRATALLLEEREEEAINETVKEAFDSQMTEFTSDMKQLIDDVNTKIDNHLKTAITQITKAAAEAVPPAATTIRQDNPAVTNITYATTLINPPPHANPKLAAREGIRARQFLLIKADDYTFGRHDIQQLKDDINKTLRELEASEGKVRAITSRNGTERSIIIEVDTDELARWLSNKINMVELCSRLGEGITFRARVFNTIVFNAPLTIDPDNPAHREEITEVNRWEPGSISTVRWAKPIDRRSQQQRSAHLFISFTSPETANRAISNGIMICNKKCQVERVKRDPLRCLKCQGWNHKANECSLSANKCSNCAQNHRTSECRNPTTKRCVSCKSNEHASWSRGCPVFLKKSEELNMRNIENTMPFFPTNDPWTWSTGASTDNVQIHRPTPLQKQTYDKGKEKQQPARTTKPTGNYRYNPINPDYVEHPSHHNWEHPSDSNARAPQRAGWWDEDPLPPDTTQVTQHTNTHPPTNNSGAAGPSNLSTYPNA
jgi:hypothetical protein